MIRHRVTVGISTLLNLLCVGACTDGRSGAEAGTASEAAFSLDDAVILLTSDGDLVLRSGPGGPVTSLTHDPALDHFGSWSPDGARIAFFSLRDGNREIYVMDGNGTGAVNLTEHPGEDLLPEWSPDGMRIAFFSTRGLEPGDLGPFPGAIYTMRPDGSELRRVTERPLDGPLGPSWSAAGDSLYFGRTVGGQVDLFVAAADGSGERRVTETPDRSEYGVDASPDGRWLTFHADGDGGATIDVMRTDGSARTSVVSEPGHHYDPRFSPDGAWIAYASSEDGVRYDVMVVPFTGGEPTTFASTPADERAPAWRPTQVATGPS